MIASVLESLYVLAVVDTLVYVVVIYAAFSRRIGAEGKTLVLVFSSYMVGVVVLYMVGAYGAGYIWFIAAIVLSALLGRRRLVVLQLVLAMLALLVYAGLIYFGLLDHDHPAFSVLIITSNLLLISLLLSYLIFRLLGSMRRAYTDQNLLSKKLADELAESRRYQNELAALIEHKDELLRELHHRVKNNLQTLSSLIQLELAEPRAECIEYSAEQGQRMMQRSIALLSVVNDLFLQNEAVPWIDAAALLDSLVYYAVDSDAARPFICSVLVEQQCIGFFPQDATVIALATAEILSAAARGATACRISLLSVSGQSLLRFQLSADAAAADGIYGLQENLKLELTGSRVMSRFFATLPTVAAVSASELLITLDVSSYAQD
ncbi:MAG: hypothetical protein KKI09_07620, partial [Spirochaetes bacterium]|nr:hypothetical protein [Spirochaetota bacterium]